jgi:hypothetical protein
LLLAADSTLEFSLYPSGLRECLRHPYWGTVFILMEYGFVREAYGNFYFIIMFLIDMNVFSLS